MILAKAVTQLIGEVKSMKLVIFRSVVGAVVFICSAGCGWAQSDDFGRVVYKASCAVCHGENAKGAGPLAAELRSKPSDLSVLAKNNNGVFPVEAIYETIDGRKAVASHGTREMPVWGSEFLSFGSDSQLIVRNRILAVIDYLSRIQVK
jgi:hypothetical protein